MIEGIIEGLNPIAAMPLFDAYSADARRDVDLDRRRDAPATARNREAILAVLQAELPTEGRVLEISSGTGQHAVFFASRLQPRLWQPSEPDPMLRESIRAWAAAEPTENLLPPLDLDVMRSPWPVEGEAEAAEQGEAAAIATSAITAIVNINMIHIAPWEACLALLAGAGRILPADGLLYLYGPYKRQGQHTASSNAAFDQSLRSRNPAWGIRDLEAVVEIAATQHLNLHRIVEMPANNLSIIFRRA